MKVLQEAFIPSQTLTLSSVDAAVLGAGLMHHSPESCQTWDEAVSVTGSLPFKEGRGPGDH